MNSFKNYLIATLTGLLVLTLSTQSSQSASKTSPVTLSYSDLKSIAEATPFVKLTELTQLAEYQSCLSSTRFGNGYFPSQLEACKSYKP